VATPPRPEILDTAVLKEFTSVAQPAPPPILETNYNNPKPSFDLSSPTWARDVVHGQTFLSGLTNTAPYEWTQVLSPSEDYEVDLIGLSGLVISANLSDKDNPFLHPFGFDWEFFIAPDPQYQYLAAPPPPSSNSSAVGSHSEYATAVGLAKTQFGLTVPDVLGVETDRNLVPVPYRVLPGDRVCVWGRWIVDTGHDDFHTEIHPPLLLVAGRPYVIAGAPPSSAPDATLTTIVGRPYLVGQQFGDGPTEQHLLNEVGKVLSFRSKKIEAHPTIMPKAFSGVFLVSYTVRPPTPRLHPQDVLMVKYNLIARTGVVVELTNSGDAVTVYLSMNDVQYTAPALPNKQNTNITLSQLKNLSPDAGDVYEGVIFGSILVNPLFAPIVLSTGIETDSYDPPAAKSAHDNNFTRVPVTSLPGNTPLFVDNSQPFPIYGTVALEWERHASVAGGAVVRDNILHP
jgi:hypothetical protein